MPYEPINIPPLRESDTPRRYKLQPKPDTGLEVIVKRLVKTIAQSEDIRRKRFPNVGEQEAQRIRR